MDIRLYDNPGGENSVENREAHVGIGFATGPIDVPATSYGWRVQFSHFLARPPLADYIVISVHQFVRNDENENGQRYSLFHATDKTNGNIFSKCAGGNDCHQQAGKVSGGQSQGG